MKINRILSLLVVLFLLFFLPVSAMNESLKIVDMAGRGLILEKPVERIIALQPADCEILYGIGAGGLLVGRGEYCNYPEDVLLVPSVQSGFETNFEQIIALSPDVVVMPKMGQREDDIKKLEAAGIITVVSDAQTIAGVYESITLLGQLTGKVDNAKVLLQSMMDSFARIRLESKDKVGGSVYFEASPLEYGLWTAGAGTFMHEIAGMLGLTNVFADLEGWQSVSEEQVLTRDPDYIVTTAMYFGEGLEPAEEVLARPNWENIKAVRNSKVFNADSDAITRPGPRLVDAAWAFFDFVYGE